MAQGIRLEMPVAEAQSLVRDLVLTPYEPSIDRRELAKLAEACERFSPSVALEDSDEPESLLLDISNVEHLWNSEAALGHELKRLFMRRGYRVQIAVAGTVGLAWGLAHSRLRMADGGLRIGWLQSAIPGTPWVPQSEIELPIESLR